MKTIFALLIFATLVFSKSETVYICVSPTAKKYHYSQKCRGLQKCTHTIKSVTLSEASKLGYTACLIEK